MNPETTAKCLLIEALTKTHENPSRAFKQAYINAPDTETRDAIKRIAKAFRIEINITVL